MISVVLKFLIHISTKDLDQNFVTISIKTTTIVINNGIIVKIVHW